MKSNGRTAKQDATVILSRIADINETFGTNYHAEHDGVYGWHLYEIDSDGLPCERDLGFSGAKSTAEMYAFTDGLYAMMRLMHNRLGVKF